MFGLGILGLLSNTAMSSSGGAYSSPRDNLLYI